MLCEWEPFPTIVLENVAAPFPFASTSWVFFFSWTFVDHGCKIPWPAFRRVGVERTALTLEEMRSCQHIIGLRASDCSLTTNLDCLESNCDTGKNRNPALGRRGGRGELFFFEFLSAERQLLEVRREGR